MVFRLTICPDKMINTYNRASLLLDSWKSFLHFCSSQKVHSFIYSCVDQNITEESLFIVVSAKNGLFKISFFDIFSFKPN